MSIRTTAAALFLFVTGTAQGAIISWTDWTSATEFESANGTVNGIGVTFMGLLTFAQLDADTTIGDSTTQNFWTEGSPAPYTGNPLVDNAPTANELVALHPASSNVLTFDSPVLNPLMAIVSMGQGGLPVIYDFDTPFTVLSEGRGFWGDGSFALGPGDQLIGTELHAVIQFDGLVSSINWTSTAENWHGFTLGLAPTAVPEPGTLGLFGAGLLGVYWARRRARR